MMLLIEFLIFTVVVLKLVSARLEYPDLKPRCHFETISCPCGRYGTAVKSVNVTLKVCNRLNLNEHKKSVCNGRAIVEKCRGAYLVQGRERRNADSQSFYCVNGTVNFPMSGNAHVGPPQVTINGPSRNFNVGEHAIFKCTFISSLPVTVTWLYNGRPLIFQRNDSHYSYLECKAVLQVKLLLSTDQGDYTCVVNNTLGQSSNASSHLSIIAKDKGPFITYFGLQNDRESNTAVIGSNINITCEAQNTAVVSWFFKDGVKLNEGNGEHYTFYNTPDEKNNLKISNLEVKNVTSEDAGNYTCFLFLDGLRKTTSFHLRVVPPDHGDELEKDKRSSPPGGTSTEYIVGIVFGTIIVIIAVVVALYCVAKRRRWLSLPTRTNSTRQLDLQPEVNGSCGNTADSRYLEVVRRPPEVDYEAKYDVFICYSFKDIAWVKELQTELETRHFTCCIDFKDFIPGAPIVENIYQAIYHSRKTVAVLSPDFVNSEWCNHELQKALTRIRSHQVVPIVYRSCEIPLVLRDRTYLDWENCHVKPYFWEQLERSLKQPNDGQSHLDNGGAQEAVVS